MRKKCSENVFLYFIWNYIKIKGIMSGDPTYITSHKGARSMIMKVERDELVEELLNEYIKNKSWER